MLLLAGCGKQAVEGERAPLRLVLDYLPNPIHAGIYYAQDSGYYEEAGVALSITAPTSTTDTLRLVAAGRADIGLVPLMDFFQAVENGQDLVLIMALVDRPLAAVLVREVSEVTRPLELEGKRVGLTGVPSDALTLEAMIRADGGDPGKVRMVTIGFNAAQHLVAGNVDAAFGFWSYEGVIVRRSLRLLEFQPQDYGIPPYPEIVAFARREFVERHPQAIEDFRRATVEGYATALSHSPDAALGPLAARIDGESVADLIPFWEVLHPVLPGRPGFSGQPDVATLQAYHNWIVESGFLTENTEVDRLIFSLPQQGHQ